MPRLIAGVRAVEVEPSPSRPPAEGFRDWLLGQLRVRHMSQRQLAQRSGVDHSSISRLVRGDRVPSLRTAMKLARGINPADSRYMGSGREAVPPIHPPARVEYSLRADDRLSEADIREIMLYYLATRHGRRGQASRPTPK